MRGPSTKKHGLFTLLDIIAKITRRNLSLCIVSIISFHLRPFLCVQDLSAAVSLHWKEEYWPVRDFLVCWSTPSLEENDVAFITIGVISVLVSVIPPLISSCCCKLSRSTCSFM